MNIPIFLSFRLLGNAASQKRAIAERIEMICEERMLPAYSKYPELYTIDGWGLVGTRLACNVKYRPTGVDLGRVVA